MVERYIEKPTRHRPQEKLAVRFSCISNHVQPGHHTFWSSLGISTSLRAWR